MKQIKIWLDLNEAEYRYIVYSLNTLRTKLIQAGRYTDVVDDALAKIMGAPIRKVKVS